MWRAYDTFGFLQYSFVEAVVAVHPFMVLRLIGGLMFLVGAVMMVVNMVLTINSPSTEIQSRGLDLPAGSAVAGE
jgi:cytochrome c oxidase cbb3-type subunit 1